MIIENTQVFGFESAIRGMRNPMNSWGKSDSYILDAVQYNHVNENCSNNEKIEYEPNVEKFVLGRNDMELSQKLSKAGTEHCKHLRLINVWFDITAPRYWYLEFDTYKHKENVSCSTMHKIASRYLDETDFCEGVSKDTIETLNSYIKMFNSDLSKEEKHKWFMLIKNNLPEGYLQKRTVATNYQTLMGMYNQRKNHRLHEWREFCKWVLSLPYFKHLTGIEE